MKKINTLLLVMFVATIAIAQPENTKLADESISFTGGGSMGKKTIVPKLDKLALAQTSVMFKTASTKEFLKNERGILGGRKSGGGSVAGRLTAYLETSDRELTQEDYQELSNHFYTALNQQLNKAGISTVDWNTVANADYYKSLEEDKDEDMKESQKKGQIYHVVNANQGKTITAYDPNKTMNFGFAFGKIKKVANFSESVGAPVLFVHVVVDFADIIVDGEAKTGTNYGRDAAGYTTITKTKKFDFNASAGANVKVAGGTTWDGKPVGGRLHFYNEKMQSDFMAFNADISSNTPFANEVSQDENRKVLNKKENIFAKDFEAVPVVIVTTKDKYKAAAKKALENTAVLLAEKIKQNRKV